MDGQEGKKPTALNKKSEVKKASPAKKNAKPSSKKKNNKKHDNAAKKNGRTTGETIRDILIGVGIGVASMWGGKKIYDNVIMRGSGSQAPTSESLGGSSKNL